MSRETASGVFPADDIGPRALGAQPCQRNSGIALVAMPVRWRKPVTEPAPIVELF